jgi:ankyrin repeat protein
MENKNPANNSSLTPLYGAAKNGHLKVCKYLMDHVDDKNPVESTGTTPLHCVADSAVVT